VTSLRLDVALVVAAALLATLLRVSGAEGDLWLDEIWSIEAAAQLASPLEVFSRGALDGHASIYTVFVGWLGAGASPLWLRLPALLSGLGLLALVPALAGTERARIPAFVLCAFSLPLVVYSTEARGYAPMLFFGLVAFVLASRYLERGRACTAVVSSVASTLAFLFHFSYAPVFVALLAWSALRLSLEKRGKVLASLALLHGLPAIVVGLSWFESIRYLPPGEGPEYSYFDAILLTLAATFGAPPFFPSTSLEAWWMLGAAALGAGLAAIELVLSLREGDRNAGFYLLVALVGPAAILGLLQPVVVLPRYFLFPVVVVCVLTARFLARLWAAERQRRACRIAAFALGAAILLGNASNLVAYVQVGKGRPGDTVALLLERSGPVAHVASDHDFRNFKLLRYHLARAGRHGKSIRYVQQAVWRAHPVDWFLHHRIDQRGPLPRSIDVENLGRAELVEEFPYAGLAGWTWGLYRVVERSP